MLRFRMPGCGDVQGLVRETRGSWPEPYRVVEVYDVELAQWREVSRTLYPLHKRAQPSVRAESREDRVHPVPLAREEGAADAPEAV